MKKAGLRSIRKCVYFLLADIVFLASVLIICILFGNITNVGLLSNAEMYIIFGTPLYLMLRGILSRIIVQRVWLPNIVFYAVIWLSLPVISGEFSLDLLFTPEGLLFATVLFLIPTITSLITGGIMRLMHLPRKHINS